MSGPLPACDGHPSGNGYCVIAAKENLIMNIEKPSTKMFNTVFIIILVAILLTIGSGIIVQRQGLLAQIGDMGMNRGDNLMPPRSTQTSPTGELVLSTGIILLTVGFGLIVLMLLVGNNWLRHNPS